MNDRRTQPKEQWLQLARRIQSARKHAKLSQRELATAIGLTDKSVSAYEKGRAIPPLEKLKQIANFTGRSLQYFTEEDTSALIIEKKLEGIQRELVQIKQLLARKTKLP